jgi:hypothetical protein
MKAMDFAQKVVAPEVAGTEFSGRIVAKVV